MNGSTEPYAPPALANLPALKQAVEDAKQALNEGVAEARRQRATWEEIGDVFGISRSGAYENWGDKSARK